MSSIISFILSGKNKFKHKLHKNKISIITLEYKQKIIYLKVHRHTIHRAGKLNISWEILYYVDI